jgi:hypothetical protein
VLACCLSIALEQKSHLSRPACLALSNRVRGILHPRSGARSRSPHPAHTNR